MKETKPVTIPKYGKVRLDKEKFENSESWILYLDNQYTARLPFEYVEQIHAACEKVLLEDA